jgi:putative transposase
VGEPFGICKRDKAGIFKVLQPQAQPKGLLLVGTFKSLIVDNGETLINCLAYIDLNPVGPG